VKLFIQEKFILSYASAANHEHAASSNHTEFDKIVNIIASFISLDMKHKRLGIKYVASHCKTSLLYPVLGTSNR
jgi:hypothetical protein